MGNSGERCGTDGPHMIAKGHAVAEQGNSTFLYDVSTAEMHSATLTRMLIWYLCCSNKRLLKKTHALLGGWCFCT